MDSDRFRFEMGFSLEHFAAGHLGLTPSATLRTELESLADAAAEAMPRVLCHRDYHSRNLMVLDSGELAMVDLQDAQWGAEGYDLASLMFDAQ